MKNKFSIAMSLAMIVAMLVTSLALADNVQDDVSGAGPKSFYAGNTTTITYWIQDTGSDGCGASDTTPVVITPSVPSGVTKAPSSLTFTACGTSSSNTQSIVYASSSPGSYDVTVSASDADTNDDYNTNPAKVTLTVLASPDSTPPVISYVLTPSLPDGSNGWYKSNVSLVWTVTDPESSVSKTGCVDQNIIADQAATDYSCSASSAGGSAGPVTVTIKRDATAPSGVSGAPNRAADNGSWYNQAVDVVFTGTDAPSGISSCTSTNYSGPDGSGVTVNGSCTDNAGNTSASVASSAFNYDGTAPTGVVLSVTAGTPGSNDWYTSDLTIHTSSDADISGVTCTVDQYQTSETIGAVFNGSCTNGAGLTANAVPLTVKLDKTGPSASLSAAGTLGTNGWYVSDVAVSTSGSDSISSPVSCTAAQSQTSDTTGQIFNGLCTNDAGLTTNAAELTIKRDATAPTLAPTVSPNPVTLNGSATASPNASDATSGVASSSCDAVDTSSIGAHSVDCTATDNAGNTNSASASYSVIYNFLGFFQPIDNLPVLNKVKAGSAIPVKFSLSGNQGLNIFAAGYPVSTVTACGTTTTDIVETTVTAGSSSLSYDATADHYNYVWKTDKTWAGTCRTLTVKLADGTLHQANFQFTK